ncbi:MAG: 3-deoxy-7-phosphoheptulonate synthase [Lachnospiraceae bacterium]|jgi:3-deoxy-7-phosphoheptulonate synthase|nr:3-deoxy-7-phosphoheptulonate synthase [Lachnospiraceae bacterium]
MSFVFERELPSAQHLKELLPVDEKAAAMRERRIALMKKIMEGEYDRLMVIVGPCSADNEEAVLDYMHRLAKVQEKVADKIFIVPRVYTNKPRTTGEGYKGMMHQPDPTQKPNAFEGLKAIRHMHIRVMQETGLVAADEMLYPGNYAFLDDVLGYVAVGARSVENQQHRLTCSGLDIPVGMKNGTGGDVDIMFNAIRAAQSGHDFIYQNWEVATEGNPYAHAVLRGGVDSRGLTIPNYHFEDLLRIAQEYQARGLSNPAIIVDTNHSNSAKQYEQQPRIASEVMHSMKYDPILRSMVKGFMIESYIEPGAQKIDDHQIYGKSITDPCLGWKETERMIYEMAEKF